MHQSAVAAVPARAADCDTQPQRSAESHATGTTRATHGLGEDASFRPRSEGDATRVAHRHGAGIACRPAIGAKRDQPGRYPRIPAPTAHRLCFDAARTLIVGAEAAVVEDGDRSGIAAIAATTAGTAIEAEIAASARTAIGPDAADAFRPNRRRKRGVNARIVGDCDSAADAARAARATIAAGRPVAAGAAIATSTHCADSKRTNGRGGNGGAVAEGNNSTVAAGAAIASVTAIGVVAVASGPAGTPLAVGDDAGPGKAVATAARNRSGDGAPITTVGTIPSINAIGIGVALDTRRIVVATTRAARTTGAADDRECAIVIGGGG